MSPLKEHLRRKHDAKGSLLRLADGQHWLFRKPLFSLDSQSLTKPDIDHYLDAIFEQTVATGEVELSDLYAVAYVLLSENYHFSDQEFSELVTISQGDECNRFADALMELLFGDQSSERTYSDWIRLSLRLNNLYDQPMDAKDLSNCIAFFVESKRCPSPRSFIDSLRLVTESDSLDGLV